MDSINQRVKGIRLALRMSQEDFGKAIGLSKSGISNIESGTRELRDIYQQAICNVFSVNSTYLRTGKGQMFLAASAASYDAFIDYLKSIGYIIHSYTSPNGEDTEIELMKDGYSSQFTLNEFEHFKEEVQDSVDYQIWKKQKGKNIALPDEGG